MKSEQARRPHPQSPRGDARQGETTLEGASRRQKPSTATSPDLRTSEIRYRRLFEAARDGILILDPSTRKITDANPFMSELLGYPHKELVGKELWEIGLLKDEEASRAAFRDLQQNHFVRYENLPLQSKNGQRREVEFVSNLYDESGAEVIQCNIRDITERKRSEALLRVSEERFRALFELGPVAVYSCDASGVIREFNGRAAELWGRAPRIGDTAERFCGSFKLVGSDGSFRAHENCPMAEVLSGKIPSARDVEAVIERPDNSRITVIVNIRLLKNERGEITGAINCFYDVTDRKRAEEALRLSYTELRSQADELFRFNRVAVGRELRMIEMKKEVNDLCQRLGEAERYPVMPEQGIPRSSRQFFRASD